MSTGRLEVICGKDSSGKTAMALGRALQALTEQKTVIVIQFLKGSEKTGNLEVLKRMEPELKVFRFEKSDRYFAELSDAEKKDEEINIRNGLNYAKKVLTTEEDWGTEYLDYSRHHHRADLKDHSGTEGCGIPYHSV